MFKKTLGSLIIGMVALSLEAQEFTVRVLDMQTKQPLKNVRVLGWETMSTAKDGTVTIPFLDDERYCLEKEGYYNLCMSAELQDPDDGYVLEVYLVRRASDLPVTEPSNYKQALEPNLQGAKELSFEAFEYHFVHDQLPDSRIKLTIWDEVNAFNHRQTANEFETKYGIVSLGWVNPKVTFGDRKSPKMPYQLSKFLELGRKFFVKK
jgi:hypothetical protein